MSVEHRADGLTMGDSVEYLAKNLAELQRLHAGKWVALAGTTVRFTHDDLTKLQEEITSAAPDDLLVIDYVPLPGEVLDWK